MRRKITKDMLGFVEQHKSNEEFFADLSKYLEELQAAQNEAWEKQNYTHSGPPQYAADTGGSKYIRIVRMSGSRPGKDDDYDSRSVHCFVERSTGLIWKAAGWKTPAKNFPRGSIYQLPKNKQRLLIMGR